MLESSIIMHTMPHDCNIWSNFAVDKFFLKMDIQVVLMQMVVLFLLVVAGFASHKCGLMGGEFDRKLSNFVIQVTAPCLILSSVMGDELPDRSQILPLILVGAVTYALLISVAYVLPRFMPVKREDHGIYSFMLAYSNVGFIGYPIVASIFGASAVFYACILNVANTLTIFVFGVMFVTGQGGGKFKWNLLWSPSMLATYLSIVVVAIGMHTPQVIARPFTLLGNMTVPASLLVIGSSIAGIPARRMLGSRGLYLMCVLKLVVLPYLLLKLAYAVGVNAQIAQINMVLIGMPVASFGTMFCLKYGRDETVMAQGTFLSTLFSVVSIPLLTMMF